MHAAAALAALLAVSCAEPPHPAAAAQPAAPDSAALVARGEYLVTIGGCNDCHSPKRMGPAGPEIIPELMLSGYPASQPVPAFDSRMFAQGFSMFTPDLTAAAGPWGVSFAANLTSDETGIGNWTAEQFERALREGKSKGLEGGRALLPPMPWMNLSGAKSEDLRAMFAYLKSTPPVRNVVPAPIPPSGN
jgi:mono/diheme cytochrome c family protein